MFSKIFRYLAEYLEEEKKKDLELNFGKNAEIHKEAKLHNEAKIFNLQGNKQQIKVGRNTHIRGELLVFGHGGEISIGEDCYIGESTRVWSAKKINIGNRVLVSHNVNIHDCNAHPINHQSRHQHYLQIITKGHPTECNDIESEAINIEEDCWIGFNATILKGVTIGKRSIIGANSIVTRDLPEDSIVVPDSNLRLLK